MLIKNPKNKELFQKLRREGKLPLEQMTRWIAYPAFYLICLFPSMFIATLIAEALRFFGIRKGLGDIFWPAVFFISLIMTVLWIENDYSRHEKDVERFDEEIKEKFGEDMNELYKTKTKNSRP